LTYRVLFVCATNGLHSPMAEAMLKWLDSEHFEARSAGAICGQLHPLTVEVLNEIGIDLGQKTPKSVQQLVDEKFDYVITLGERVPSHDRNFPCTEIVHWKFDDAGALDDPEKQLLRMVRVIYFVFPLRLSAQRFFIRSESFFRPAAVKRSRFCFLPELCVGPTDSDLRT